MPIYEYECEHRGNTFQQIYMSPEDRSAELTCHECGTSDIRQVFSPPAVHTGEAKDVVQETAEQVQKNHARGLRTFDHHDLDDAPKGNR